MQVKTDKIYIDYLDHTVSQVFDLKKVIDRLKFDLLLFSEDVLCLSVPACVKLDTTTNLLMELTPFWNSGKIRLVLDRKHKDNPWNYFNKRKKILEKNFTEEELNDHFEYVAYNSSHTNFFYSVFLSEIIKQPMDFYIRKVFDTDELFRHSVINQVNNKIGSVCAHLPFENGLHMGKILNDLTQIAEDHTSLFQRSAVEHKLQTESGAQSFEMRIVNRILDDGFAYANAISSYAAPVSFIKNRLTGKSFIDIIKKVDNELFQLIHELNWGALYRLSENDTWLDLIDHLNQLIIFYQENERHKNHIFSAEFLESHFLSFDLISNLYDYAIEGLQEELLKNGFFLSDILSIKTVSDKTIQTYLFDKNYYLQTIKEIDELLSAIKVVIRSLNRNYKNSSILLREQGFIVHIFEDR